MGHIHQSMSALDLCKCAIEQFIQKMRTLHANLERSLLLLKSGDYLTNNCSYFAYWIGTDSSCLLSTLGDSYTTFERAMKNIEPSVAEHSLSHSITMGLTLLNKYRMKNNVDNFGKGLIPW